MRAAAPLLLLLLLVGLSRSKTRHLYKADTCIQGL
jgi:hypothetical protein